MGRPSISLLVPCYNAEPYVSNFLAMAKAQTWPYHEIICFDDASTDRTSQLISAQGVQIVRINRNRGPAYARQMLMSVSTGEYVHFHDVDDLLSTRFVESISPLLSADTIGLCARKEVNKLGVETTVSLSGVDKSHPLDLVTGNFLHFNQAVFPAKLAKQHMMLAPELRILEDRLAFLSVAAGGAKFRYVDEPLTTFIKRAGSVTASQSHADGMDCLYTYWKRAQPLVGDRAQKLADYVSYTAWCYYYEDEAVYPQLKRIMESIKDSGLTPITNPSRIERQLGRFLNPAVIYWLRRKRAQPRSLNRSGTTAVGEKTNP
jgi:glycosyltransferase involved in cell wall biosynthesis